jgi:rubrerythrin
MKSFAELSEREILALAISSEEEDGRVYADFAEGMRDNYPETARMFQDMAAEEGEHRRVLIDLFVAKFGDHIPFVRRSDVRGTVQRKRLWQVLPLGAEHVRRQAKQMEQDAARFYRQAAARSSDAAIRKLLGDLAEAEARHERTASAVETKYLSDGKRDEENDSAQRRFVLQIIQPGLVGLMDGSVSTLAPVFAAAFATHNTVNAFQVGLAASLGAGKLSGRGTPYLRGLVCGLMTIAGGIGHTLPYLIDNFFTATVVAGIVVVFELLAIAWIQWRFMDTPPVAAAAKVMLGGGLVLATGILIGSG